MFLYLLLPAGSENVLPCISQMIAPPPSNLTLHLTFTTEYVLERRLRRGLERRQRVQRRQSDQQHGQQERGETQQDADAQGLQVTQHQRQKVTARSSAACC